VINNSEAELLIIDKELIDKVQFIGKDLSFLKIMIIRQEGLEEFFFEKPEIGFKLMNYRELFQNPTIPPLREINYFDPMVIMYTSGTTGPSKGAVLSHKACYVFAFNHAKYLRITQDDVLYTCLPLFHGISFLLTTLSTILTDAKIVIGKRFSASTFWDEISRCKATYFPMVGAMAHILFKQPPTEQDAHNPVRIVYSIPAPAQIYAEFEKRFNVKLIEAYGSTDGQVIVYQPFHNPKIGACGQLIEGFELKIVDDADEELPIGTVGEIVYRTKEPFSMMQGYYKNPQATMEVFRNFWFHSGDHGYLDEDGYLHFVDRKKDSIRRRGENISSYEIEKVINLHEDVIESAAIAVPSEIGEEDVKIIVVLKEGKNIKPEDLIQFCEVRMPYFMVPRYIEFKAALPKTPNEKVQKYKLRGEGITSNTWDRERAGYKLKR
jgi:crotonobetaine/carnitine-CoA ligase